MIAVLLGTLFGIFIGTMPGLGPVTILLALMPVLLKVPLIDLFLFYFSMVLSSQYYGSIVAIVYGILGEPTSTPAVQRGHFLFRAGAGNDALLFTSAGSFIAGTMSVLIFWLTYLLFSDFFIFLLKGNVIVLLLTIMMLVLILSSKNKFLSFIFILAGLILGKIGIFRIAETRFLTFNFDQLDAGIPVFPLMCGLIIIPVLYNLDRSKLNVSDITQTNIDFVSKIKSLAAVKYYRSILRGSIIGFFIGLIPGASYLLSSNVADLIENRITKASDNKDLHCLISAESANNSGVVTSLIPLIVLGLPILVSESIILNIAELKGFSYNNSIDFLHEHATLIFLWLLAINLINWLLSGIFYNYILRSYKYVYKYGYKIIIVTALAILFWGAITDRLLVTSAITFLAALSVGFLVKDMQVKYCLIVAYFISPLYIDEVYRLLT